MKVSVIICTYNRSASLRRTLSSLIPANIHDGCEVIVVDNDSSDDTQDVLREYQEKYPSFFRYCVETTRGKAAALNHGVRVAQGDSLVFTDDDVILPDDWMNEIVRALNTYVDCDIFGGRVVPVPPAGMEFPDWIHWKDPYNIAEGPLVDHNKGNEVKSYHEPGMCVPVGANFFARKSAFSRHGYYTGTGTPATAEDSVWSNKAKNAGDEILYIPTVVVNHVTDEKRLSKRYFLNYARYSAKTCKSNIPGDQKSPSRVMNVPTWFFAKLFTAVWVYLLSVLSLEKRSLVYAKKYSVIYFAWVVVEFMGDYSFRNGK